MILLLGLEAAIICLQLIAKTQKQPESHNAYNWRAISVPPERFGSSLGFETYLIDITIQ